MMTIKGSIGVIGAGTMGAGIAQAFGGAGYHVLLADQTLDQARDAVERTRKHLLQRVEAGKLTRSEFDEIGDRLEPVGDLSRLASCGFVIEAVFEHAKAKMDVLTGLDSQVAQDIIIATNTSTIPITQLATAVSKPERFVGMHFFNPVPVMKLVEVVNGYRTDKATTDTVFDLAKTLGKTPVIVNDSPGFVSNRILAPLINEAIFVLSEGVATREDIDAVMKLGMNHPMGPLELADLIGLDVCLQIIEVLYHEFGDPKYRPAPLLRRMVTAGYLGRKTGHGFYEY